MIRSQYVIQIAPEDERKQLDMKLSDREFEVLNELALGYSRKEISNRLFLSTHTIDTHMRSLYYKLNARNNVQAVIQGIRLQLIAVELMN